MKEQYWKITAQCLLGTLGGMTGGVIGFFTGIIIGSNYEIGGVYGAIAGMIIGSIISVIFFMKRKIESYRNMSMAELLIAIMIVITAIISRYLIPMTESNQFSILHISTAIMTLFMIFSLVTSLLITVCIYLYKKKHQ